MGGAANPIVGSLLNGLGTNILAGNDPVKGALINASALAGSGNMGGAIARTPSASAGIDATSQFGNYLNTTGANASLLNPAVSAGIDPASQFGSYLNKTGANNSLLNPATTAGIDPNSQFGNYLNITGTNISTPINNTIGNGSNAVFPAPIEERGTMANPSFFDQFKGFARENPMLTQIGFATAKDVLTPEQIAQAPTVPVQARGQLRNYDPVAALDPYRQSALSNPQISLI